MASASRGSWELPRETSRALPELPGCSDGRGSERSESAMLHAAECACHAALSGGSAHQMEGGGVLTDATNAHILASLAAPLLCSAAVAAAECSFESHLGNARPGERDRQTEREGE